MLSIQQIARDEEGNSNQNSRASNRASSQRRGGGQGNQNEDERFDTESIEQSANG